jgi:hypothetical protein
LQHNRLDAFDPALAGIDTAADLRAYLDQPTQQAWMARLRRTSPQQAEQADTLLAAAWARVDPASREGAAPLPWREMSWPIFSRGGACQDMQDPDAWEAEFGNRIQRIEQHPKGTVEDKRRLIGAVLDCNREVLEHLRERGHGAAVECVEGLFAEALDGAADMAEMVV